MDNLDSNYDGVVKEYYELGETPPLGVLPKKMIASVIRPDRYGDPIDGYRTELIDVPEPGDNQVLVWVMAAGINYNGVWSSLGFPYDVIRGRQAKGAEEDFHIGGSDGSGIVWKVGKSVSSVRVGDHVVLGAGQWDEQATDMRSGDPMLSDTVTAWGYESNWGTFAQFALVDHYQCIPKPPNLSWEAAACYMASGSTAYRMLHSWPPNVVKPNDVVLVWGGAGGLGSMAIQIIKEAGGRAVAVVSSDDKIDYCMDLGATAVINRNKLGLTHWGRLPDIDDEEGYAAWSAEVRKFGRAIWDGIGERRNPDIVFEHTGEDTIPTSLYLVATGGMVVTCAGTTGYNGDIDLRFLWMRQKRLQGSHIANTDDCRAITQLIADGKVDAAPSEIYEFEQMGMCHQMMHENRHPHGNMAIRVNVTNGSA